MFSFMIVFRVELNLAHIMVTNSSIYIDVVTVDV